MERTKYSKLSVSALQGISEGKKKSTYLIAPFVDDRHVDIINEAGHLATSWRAIRGTYTFIYIALNCALWKEHVKVQS